MRHRVVVPKKIEKKLEKLDKKSQARIQTGLIILESNPYAGKKLEGRYKNCYSLKVWPYRIIYEIIQTKLIVLTIEIGHRQGVY